MDNYFLKTLAVTLKTMRNLNAAFLFYSNYLA